MTRRIHGIENAGMITIIVARPKAATRIWTTESTFALYRTTVSTVAMNSMWWPVRNTYRSGVKRAMISEPMTPMNIANATFWATSGMSLAIAVIASLVGTTPSTPKAPVISAPSGFSAPMTAPAPMPRMMKPSVAFSDPPMMSPRPLRDATRAISVIRPTRYAGTPKMSRAIQLIR